MASMPDEEDVHLLMEFKELAEEKLSKLENFITKELKGRDINLVMKKTLFHSDLDKNQNRLSMPLSKLETHEFLTPDEKKTLEDRKPFEVRVLGPSLQLYKDPMAMNMWSLKNVKIYVLIKNWNKFVKDNKDALKVNGKIHVWSFRMPNNQLSFAISCVEEDEV